MKPRLLGHWGTTPGLNLLYAHMNRAIRERDLNAIYVTGPGHGGPGLVANTYLEGTYSEVYPRIGEDEEGMRRLFRQFSFPGGIPRTWRPRRPGSIHEGGELGYALVHAYGAIFDNPDLLALCVVGDGEAETGPLAASWHSNKFVNPARDGAVLPVLHLNGYKIANPTVLARIPQDELRALLEGYGHAPVFVEGDEPEAVHRALAEALDGCLDEIARIQARARDGAPERPRWPMIVLRTPKGWTGPKEVDGQPAEGTFRSHQVPLAERRRGPRAPARCSRSGCARTGRRSCSTSRAALAAGAPRAAPEGERRMGANPHANGGLLLRDLELPDFRDYAVAVEAPGTAPSEATRVLGAWLRDVMRERVRAQLHGLRAGRDRLEPARRVFEVTDRAWMAERSEGRRPPLAGRPRDGDPQRAPLPGLARGLPPHRPARRSSTATRRSSTSSTRCSTSTPKWLKVTRRSRGGGRSRRSTTCSRRTSGARTTTASRTRTRASSTTS